MKDQDNVVVSAPTSSGKTIIFELAIIKEICKGKLRCLYLAPIKSLCHEKSNSWQNKFKQKLKVFELTSDTSPDE
jgi:ATP-dependent DNA helicase HFM1/MER3